MAHAFVSFVPSVSFVPAPRADQEAPRFSRNARSPSCPSADTRRRAIGQTHRRRALASRKRCWNQLPNSRRTSAAPAPRASSFARATSLESGTIPQLVQG